MLRAGRMVLARIAEFTKARTDFALETTLAGRSYVPLLRGVRKAGFRAHMFYLWIPSPELALLRIRHRVESGGHDVPEADVRRRFRRTLRNLFRLNRPLLDTLHFFDNASEPPQLVFIAGSAIHLHDALQQGGGRVIQSHRRHHRERR